MPKVATSFDAVRPGDVYPTRISAGETVEGRLAEIAAALGALEAPAGKTAPANKAAKRAPENKG